MPETRKGDLFRRLRITLLLLLLVAIALGQWQARARVTDWDRPLWVVLHPVDADGSVVAGKRVQTLEPEQFAAIEAFFVAEAARHGLPLAEPVLVRTGPSPETPPPLPPADAGPLGIALWSLKLRLWAFGLDDHPGVPTPDVRLAVRYFNPATHPRLPHSLGLANARVGIVNAFADPDYHGSNRVVIAHELLHTLGAGDKYDPATNLPRFPDGYAEPARTPRHPQAQAELMGGRIPLGPADARMPESLEEVVIGIQTAREIGWLD
jgi:hypothetical protein